MWECKCQCGNIKDISGVKLRSGKYKTCGCNLTKIKKDRDLVLFKKQYYQMIKRNEKLGFNETDITIEKFIELIKQECYYCGSKDSNSLKDNLKSKSYRLKFNGLDRINNTKGYEIDNVVPCCKYCNRSKSTLTVQEFIEQINNQYKHLEDIKKLL
jgi:5-methylcytosine-specific restriction endonuclease McrA